MFRQKPPCLSYANDAVLMLISRNLHNKSSEVSIKTRSTPASLSFNGEATKHTTVKWSIAPNTVANSTKIIVLATKIQKLVAKLATRTLWVLYILP